MKTKYKNFTIESELTNSDPAIDTTITKGKFWGSIGAAEFEGLSDDDGNTIRVPQSVIDKAYDLEDEMYSKQS